MCIYGSGSKWQTIIQKTPKIALKPQLSKRAQIVNGLSRFSLKISEQKRKEICQKSLCSKTQFLKKCL